MMELTTQSSCYHKKLEILKAYNMSKNVHYYFSGMENTFISPEDVKDPRGRDPERTPMQWDNTSFAGTLLQYLYAYKHIYT